MRQRIRYLLREPHYTAPIVPNEAGRLERKETPDKESIGGVLTFAWPPLSDQEVIETQVLKFIRTRVVGWLVCSCVAGRVAR